MLIKTIVKETLSTIAWTVLLLVSAFILERGAFYTHRTLMPCEHGTAFANFTDRSGNFYCDCAGTPFNGTFCSKCMCKYNGSCSTEPTTPFQSNTKYGCKCPFKRFGYLCEQCNTIDDSKNETCNSTCKTNYFGEKCDNVCFPNLSYNNNNSICNFIRSVGGECNTCNGHGTCHNGKCQCHQNWYNDDKQLACTKTCKGHPICSGHGRCKSIIRNPSCLCNHGWHGDLCNIKCPGMMTIGKPCNGHGICSVNVTTKNATCKCNEKFRGKDCTIECPGEIKTCDGYGTCDSNGVCHCKASSRELCVASLAGTGDGDCMSTRKAFGSGGCSSKNTLESCSILNIRNDNCCQWKCVGAKKNRTGSCIQLKSGERRVDCTVIVDKDECLKWKTLYDMKICDWNASTAEVENIGLKEEEEDQYVEIDPEATQENYDDQDIEIIDPDKEVPQADNSAAITIKDSEPERIMENCKPKGKNLPPNAKLQIGIIEREEENCEERFSKIDTVKADFKYVAYFYKNCSVFDAYYEEKPYSLLLAQNMYLIKGFTQGLSGMCKGETRRIIVPSKLGYGKMGAAYIPGNTTLVYEVQMVKLENVKEDKK